LKINKIELVSLLDMEKETISWIELIKLTKGETFEVERVRIQRTGIALEGRFELPSLIKMSEEDQVFISAFLHSHGSIKEMERLFGISYPTVKARLTRIAEQLPFVEVLENSKKDEAAPTRNTPEKYILDQLAQGEINSAEAVKLLRNRRGEK
jgi:hypothetical protein